VNSGRAYAAMRARYPTWEALASARTADLVRVIRPGGLANTKAPRILAVLREIREREGRFDLSWMADASDREISEYLTSLPGVGPKTVAVVLAFALGRPALPVDTHVHRVAGRLELVPPRSTAVQAQIALERLVPPRLRVPMHVGLIRHGRQICRAGRPRCEDCVLRDICPSADLFLAAAASGRSGGAKNPKEA
jgi:endonuclease-3